MIKAITFDLDGVYFINGKENFIKNLLKLGVSEDEARRVFLKSDRMNKEYKKGTISDDEFWSWAITEWKPNSKMFEELIRQSGVKSDEIAYADDSEVNIEEAKNLGINAFFYKSNEQFMADLHEMGVVL